MEILKVVPLRKNLWALNEISKTIMYVVNGQNYALLLDTGFGLSPLKSVVNRLCGNRPVIVVNTHGHMDHNSGNNQFDSVYVGRYDEPESHSATDKSHIREMFFQALIKENYDLSSWNAGPSKNVRTLKDGDVIDLGDYKFDVLETPGHSIGSITLLEKNQRWLFTGDLVLTWEVWGQLKNSSTLRIYAESLERLAKLEKNVDVVFPAHGIPEKKVAGYTEYELPPEILSIYAKGVRKIVDGRDKGVEYLCMSEKMRRSYFTIGGIVFDPGRIG